MLQLYGALVVLLSPDEDIVVRIAATSTLQHVIDDFGFRANVLVPFLADLMPLMFDLLASVAECDSKMKVLGIITLIVDRVGSTHMEVYTNTLFECVSTCSRARSLSVHRPSSSCFHSSCSLPLWSSPD
jgi:hypothetical protein